MEMCKNNWRNVKKKAKKAEVESDYEICETKRVPGDQAIVEAVACKWNV